MRNFKLSVQSVLLLLVSLSFAQAHAAPEENCPEAGITLQILGSGGPELDDGLSSTSYLIWQNSSARLLVDTGPGSSILFGEASADFNTLDAVLFTHLHVDHSSDLPAYVKGSFFTDRQKNLPILGPNGNALMPSTTVFLERLFGPKGAFAYLQGYLKKNAESYQLIGKNVPIDGKSVFTQKVSEKINVKAIGVNHGPVAAVAWRVDSGDCSIVFTGDTSNKYDRLPAFAHGADILVAHNAVPESATGAARNLHMPPSEIGKIAAKAGAKKLVLSHFMNRTIHRKDETLREIRKFYSGPVIFAQQLQMID